MDRRLLRDVLLPVLERAVNFYPLFLTPDSNGTLHLAATRSPEYANASDRTYDLSLLTPNTMYREGNNKALESPFTGANAILDMLAHSGPGVVRVFSATPAAWADVSIADLRAEGAFRIDAARFALPTHCDQTVVVRPAGDPLPGDGPSTYRPTARPRRGDSAEGQPSI